MKLIAVYYKDLYFKNEGAEGEEAGCPLIIAFYEAIFSNSS